MNSDNHRQLVNLQKWQKYVTTLLLQGQNTLQLSSPTLHMDGDGMVWSLLGTPLNGQAAFYLIQGHLSTRSRSVSHTHTKCVVFFETNTEYLVVCVQCFPLLTVCTPQPCQQVESNLVTTTFTHAFQTINYFTIS